MYEVRGERFLEAHEQIPAGKKEWQPVGEGKFMPFDGGPYNGGKWLHTQEEWAAMKGKGGADAFCRRY